MIDFFGYALYYQSGSYLYDIVGGILGIVIFVIVCSYCSQTGSSGNSSSKTNRYSSKFI